MNEKSTIIFVYNADSGLFNALTDTAHKIFSPSTYECNLCALTHGNFGMRNEWKAFLESLNIEMEFLHKNELAEHYKINNAKLPAIYNKIDNQLTELIPADLINQCQNLAELKQLIQAKLP